MLTNKDMALIKKVDTRSRNSMTKILTLQKGLQDRTRHLLRGLESQTKVRLTCCMTHARTRRCSARQMKMSNVILVDENTISNTQYLS
jgi:hypothetical protein